MVIITDQSVRWKVCTCRDQKNIMSIVISFEMGFEEFIAMFLTDDSKYLGFAPDFITSYPIHRFAEKTELRERLFPDLSLLRLFFSDDSHLL